MIHFIINTAVDICTLQTESSEQNITQKLLQIFSSNFYHIKSLIKDQTVSDQDVNWTSPVQGKSPLVQVKEPYSNLDMVTCRLSSCNLETVQSTPADNAREGGTMWLVIRL